MKICEFSLKYLGESSCHLFAMLYWCPSGTPFEQGKLIKVS